jgi:hypothetical protein
VLLSRTGKNTKTIIDALFFGLETEVVSVFVFCWVSGEMDSN